nr:putative transcription initiation factor tfiid 111 kda [Quercus suber]
MQWRRPVLLKLCIRRSEYDEDLVVSTSRMNMRGRYEAKYRSPLLASDSVGFGSEYPWAKNGSDEIFRSNLTGIIAVSRDRKIDLPTVQYHDEWSRPQGPCTCIKSVPVPCVRERVLACDRERSPSPSLLSAPANTPDECLLLARHGRHWPVRSQTLPPPYLNRNISRIMPHATADDKPADVDEDSAIQSFLAGNSFGGDFQSIDLGSHERAPDAVDYEDLDDDDDLPEEEEATNNLLRGEDDDEGAGGQDVFSKQMRRMADEVDALPMQSSSNVYHQEPTSDDLVTDDDDKDLFGERTSLSPEQERHSQLKILTAPRAGGLALPSKSSGLALPSFAKKFEAALVATSPSNYQDAWSPSQFPRDRTAILSPTSAVESAEEEEEEQDELTRIQRQMFRERQTEQEPLDLEEFYALFPSYRADQNPRFTDLFPQRRAPYRGKAPPKPPKPVQPTKLSLDLLPDQERSFRTAASTHLNAKDVHTKPGLVFCGQDEGHDEDSEDGNALSVLDENELIGGVRFRDLALICENWDVQSNESVGSPIGGGDWDIEGSVRPKKRQRTSVLDLDLALTIRDPRLCFEDPERAISRLANFVSLDLNDANLLIDEHAPQPKELKRASGDSERERTMNKDLAKRYNISNDAAYDLLKENHQHKIRSTLGSMAIEHSLPATKLQYPFYRTDLDMKAKRSFHRPALDLRDRPGREYKFQKQRRIKRKETRGRDVKEVFATAESLAHNDNAPLLLLEYSEEAPMMLSNFGMGNRLINYYRKRNADDMERPKRDIGETQVLLTQDKSPFANFGHVDQGEIVPTLQNGLYRAPVFQHTAKSNDFVVAISTTYEHGSRLYLRNLENLHTVGQQFPLTEIPGEHSRKVTDAAKKRLRALAFRIYSKSVDPTRRGKVLDNASIMAHLKDQDLGQVRSKMREFMKYERDGHKDGHGIWVPTGVVPDAETLRGWVKPEDVCLLDAMQVGVQHLRDLGINTGRNVNEDDEEEGGSIEAQLAPWQTTKNFLNATQGKAMLKLHGEGDPTGRGEGFSFVKTSMKGGFQALGESVEDRIDAKKRRDTGGHSYNVAKQQKAYDDYIRMIWDKQKVSLSHEAEQSDLEMEDEPETDAESTYPSIRAATPRSTVGTPATLARYDDESVSQFSKGSGARGGKSLIIKRHGLEHPDARRLVHIDNPEVIALYRKRRVEKRIKEISDDLMDYKPTGDLELDNAKRKKLEAELARVMRNVDRRQAREKAKSRLVGTSTAGSPWASEADGPGTGVGSTENTPQKGKRNKDGGTSRKCANCGQTGHIKTNRKSVNGPSFCPHCFQWTLNGKLVQDEKNIRHKRDGGGSQVTASTMPKGDVPFSQIQSTSAFKL